MVTKPKPALAPPPSDLEEMMADLELVESSNDFADSVDQQWSSMTIAGHPVTSPEAKKAGANFVQRTSLPKRTLYDGNGDSRQVDAVDVPMLVDAGQPLEHRLFVRCPLCSSLPNRGIHADPGPNGCAGRPKRKYTLCPICQMHGRQTRIYEELPPAHLPSGSDDPDFVPPALPTEIERAQRLQGKLREHMLAFHKAEARTLYGLTVREA